MTTKQIIHQLELIEQAAKLLQERSYTVRKELLRIHGEAPPKGLSPKKERILRLKAETLMHMNKIMLRQ